MPRIFSMLIIGGLFSLFTGCYTQLMVVDQSPPPAETEEWVIDSATGDTVKVIRQVDTIEVDDGRTCVWERDLMGYPRLRCYDSYYPSSWYYSNYSPWWYRNDPYYYDYRRCPRYYYYDPSCGCCRYTSYDYHHQRYHDNDGSEPVRRSPSGASGSSFRSRGVPDGRATGSGSSSSGTSTRSATTKSSQAGTSDNITVTNEKTKRKTIIKRRSRGVPDAGSGAKSSSPKKNSKTSSTKKSSQSSSPPSNSSTTSSSSGHQSPPPAPPQSNSNGDDRHKRRKARSW